MENSITPDDIKTRAANAYVSINRLMLRAGLPNSTFWRWEQGQTKNLHPVTLAKIRDALEAFEAERAA